MDSATLNLTQAQREEFEFDCVDYTLQLGKSTKLMAVLNLTDDSFSEDGIYKDPQKAEARVLQMVAEGADIIDIGGESTRPGTDSITVQEEKERVLPALRRIVKKVKVPISIDTTKAELAYAALSEGANIINDISGLKFDPAMADVIARFKAGCVLMHIKGRPQTMQNDPSYPDLINEIINYLAESVSIAAKAGVGRKSIIIDPGIGFGKTTLHNLQIVKRLRQLGSLHLPILIGTSRKSFIGNVLNLPIEDRLMGTATSVVASICNGAHIVRVHDVKEILQTIKLSDAILNS